MSSGRDFLARRLIIQSARIPPTFSGHRQLQHHPQSAPLVRAVCWRQFLRRALFRTIRSLASNSAELKFSKKTAQTIRAIVGRIQVDIDLSPDEEQEFTFVIGFSMAGDADAIRKFELPRRLRKGIRTDNTPFRESIQLFCGHDTGPGPSIEGCSGRS